MKKIILLILCSFLHLCLNAQNLDIRLLRSINSPVHYPADDIFRFISNSDAFVTVGVPVSIAVAGFLSYDRKMKWNACVIAIGTALDEGLTLALKYTVNRPRPFVTYPDIIKKSAGGSPSFPSGHTSTAFATATSLSLFYPKWYVIVPSYVYAATVGYSRMYLGVHYPSDVLAGALIGSGSAFLTYEINRRLIAKRRHKACDCP
ncbi:MAG: phosphatase PAP2 family protein [Bacteroidales bacterium]|jgi:membrane-associated phospholipid phosphatase